MPILRLIWVLLFAWLLSSTATLAATCGAATSGGSAAPGWDTYCWLDMSTYSDATALAGGQTMSFNLSDGSVFSFKVSTASSAATGLSAVAAPSWSGGSVGNSTFLGIPGKPILYTRNDGSTVTLTISNIKITPPAGAVAGTFMFIVADGESTNQAESLTYTTNGGNWQLLDQSPPISGSTYPTYSIAGQTATVTGVAGTVGAQIFGSVTPTNVTVKLQAGGLQGIMLAVRFASVRLNAQITGARVASADQFAYSIRSTSSGTALASNQSSGAGNGPWTDAVSSLASGISITLNEAMTAGSVSPITAYRTSLTCTNTNSGSPTTMPTGVLTNNYVLGSVAYGDAITCRFTNAAFPHLTLQKALGGNRVFAGDQVTVTISSGGTTVATTTTTGSGSTVTNGSTGSVQVSSGTSYTLDEAAAGTTNLSYYTAGLACSNAWSSSPTSLPNTVGGSLTPTYGDVVTCTITNTPKAPMAALQVVKRSAVVSDPVNGTTNPKLIPGAIVRYTITVTNAGNGPVDASTIVLTDIMPRQASTQVSPLPTFVDGTPSSTLSLASSGVTWSNAVGGGAPYTAVPNPDSQGYDGSITGIRLQPTGTMPGATASGQPSFSISFLARIN
jgi:uncharacterized repeat protein (TIGR01451 family)